MVMVRLAHIRKYTIARQTGKIPPRLHLLVDLLKGRKLLPACLQKSIHSCFLAEAEPPQQAVEPFCHLAQ
jgi:hypothetical protein